MIIAGMEGPAERECPPRYLRTISGKLKIVQMVLTVLTFALSFSSLGYHGGGWVEFTGISCFITVTIWFILHVINLIPRIMFNYFSELITYCIMTIFLLISGIIAATRAPYSHDGTTIGACSFFAFAAAIACGADGVLQYMEYRKGNYHASATTTTVETTIASQSTVTQIYY